MSLPKFKPSESACADFEFYKLESSKIGVVFPIPHNPTVETVEPDYWFWLMDTHGIKINCTDPILAAKILNTKEFVNLTIKMWATDLVEMLITPDEIKQWVSESGYRPWAYKAAINQAKNIAKKKIGFIPTFIANA